MINLKKEPRYPKTTIWSSTLLVFLTISGPGPVVRYMYKPYWSTTPGTNIYFYENAFVVLNPFGQKVEELTFQTSLHGGPMKEE